MWKKGELLLKIREISNCNKNTYHAYLHIFWIQGAFLRFHIRLERICRLKQIYLSLQKKIKTIIQICLLWCFHSYKVNTCTRWQQARQQYPHSPFFFLNCVRNASCQSLPMVQQGNISGLSVVICPATKSDNQPFSLEASFPGEKCHCVAVCPSRSRSRSDDQPAAEILAKGDGRLWIMLMWYSALPFGVRLTLQ